MARLLTLLTLLVFVGCSGAFVIRDHRQAERDRRTFEVGRRMQAKVVSARKQEKIGGKYSTRPETYFLTLEVEGPDKIGGWFQVGEADYRTHPVGAMTTVFVEEAGRFQPEICRERLLSPPGAWIWISTASLSALGFLAVLADTIRLRARP